MNLVKVTVREEGRTLREIDADAEKGKKAIARCSGQSCISPPRRHTYESGRVVVTGCLSITIGFQDRVSLYDLVFQGTTLSDGVVEGGEDHEGEEKRKNNNAKLTLVTKNNL